MKTTDLPPSERLPQLRQLPHRPLIPAGPRTTACRDKELRAGAEQRGSLRLVEVLERDEQSLTRILQGLDELEAEREQGDEAELLDVVALTAARQPDARGDAA